MAQDIIRIHRCTTGWRQRALDGAHSGMLLELTGLQGQFTHADPMLEGGRLFPEGMAERWHHDHLIAQRYGALPVARATGGLVDTIVDCDAKLETGTGFLFDDATTDALYAAVQRALSAYTSPRWGALRRRVMRLDRGWERAARQYEQAYKALK